MKIEILKTLPIPSICSPTPESIGDSGLPVCDEQALLSLLGELGGTLDAAEDLGAILRDPAVRLFVGRADNGEIVSCGCLGIMNTLSGRKGHIEDIVVSGECRGKGYGRLMMERIIAEARALGPMELFLTSRPSRVAANALYQSLGFVRKDTNCYRMVIELPKTA